MHLERFLSHLMAIVAGCWPVGAAVRQEHFDHEPATWEGYNNRSTHFPVRRVTQDFGYGPGSRHIGETNGEIGGKINPAGEAAYYGYRLPKPLTLDDALSASGKMVVMPGPGHCLLGFFNSATLNEWRTPNTLVMRINGRGENFHCHLEFCSSRWRADAGVIGEIVPGKSIAPKALASGQICDWELAYDPKGGDDGSGLATLRIANQTATCRIKKDHRAAGAAFTHFGLLPVLKAWDNPSEVWVGALTVNGKKFDFARDPGWDELNNRRTYETANTRPRFEFGWSPTQHAGGLAAGELGGLIFRGDCRYRQRMAAYGDKLALLTISSRLYARGKVAMTRGVSDSTASIGFYHSKFSLQENPAQDQSIPMDFLGINIEGPSSEGFLFYPVYRVHGDVAGANSCRKDRHLRIYPDGKSHDWVLLFEPDGARGRGQITVTLEGQSCALELAAAAKGLGASFDRFGICTPWIDGNSVTTWFDDLEYTCSPE